MRRLINYLRTMLCRHDWEYLHDAQIYEHIDTVDLSKKLPVKRIRVDRCKRCGLVWRQRI